MISKQWITYDKQQVTSNVRHSSLRTPHSALRTHTLRILLLTDVFPPRSGGSGWSTFYLGKALAERGHQVSVMRPIYDSRISRPAIRAAEYGGLQVEEILVPQAPRWVAQLKLGTAWAERAARRLMARRALALAKRGEANVLHGQHMVSIGAASRAAQLARREGVRVASVGTVRDYWPLCPVSTRLFTDAGGKTYECVDCHKLRPYLRCASHSRRGRAKALALPLAVARWGKTLAASRDLAACDAIIGVSDHVRDELARSGRVPTDKLWSIPNLVDLPSVDVALSADWPLPDFPPDMPFFLFVGKLDANKGAHLLPEALAQPGLDLPVIFAGEGRLRGELEREAESRGLAFRFYSWLDNDAVLMLMRHARALLFPSAWAEPLGRVLLEGCAAGAAIVALRTGGTGDIILHGESGWLADDIIGFKEGVIRVASDKELNARLRAGARRRAEEKFAAPKISAQVEALYLQALGDEGRRAKGERL